VSTDSLYRHAKNHFPPQLRAKLIAGPDIDLDLDRLHETESQSLLANRRYVAACSLRSMSPKNAVTRTWSAG
jgi:hypothetical protein